MSSSMSKMSLASASQTLVSMVFWLTTLLSVLPQSLVDAVPVVVRRRPYFYRPYYDPFYDDYYYHTPTVVVVDPEVAAAIHRRRMINLYVFLGVVGFFLLLSIPFMFCRPKRERVSAADDDEVDVYDAKDRYQVTYAGDSADTSDEEEI
ncbi:unnamed protein product [Amoebophrya sp. A25]|nr:unnamed protein product [Amoebophrya sp. A25]|eukprot:GSA25T00017045001.1